MAKLSPLPAYFNSLAEFDNSLAYSPGQLIYIKAAVGYKIYTVQRDDVRSPKCRLIDTGTTTTGF